MPGKRRRRKPTLHNSPMHRSSHLRRWIAHLAILALLLKAAVPMLASAAAQARGIPVAEVCDVYGVAIPRPAGPAAHAGHHEHHEHHHAEPDGREHSPDHRGHHSGAAHSGDHCALTALAAFAPPGDIEDPSWAGTSNVPQAGFTPSRDAIPDATSRWAARLKHGPPTIA